jgi:hypothetical protein
LQAPLKHSLSHCCPNSKALPGKSASQFFRPGIPPRRTHAAGGMLITRSRVLSKPGQIAARDVRLVQFLEDLGASESAGFVEQSKARNESKLLRTLSALAESGPRALRGDSSRCAIPALNG